VTCLFVFSLNLISNIDHSPSGVFSANGNKWWNKFNVNEHNMVRNPNWLEVDQWTSWLFTIVPMALNSGLLGATPCKLVVRMGLEPVTESGFQVWHSNHSATLPLPRPPPPVSLFWIRILFLRNDRTTSTCTNFTRILFRSG